LNTALAVSPRRVLLVNPTRYLGNLLIAGGLIQDYAIWCTEQGITFRVVLDEAFAPLVTTAFPEGCVLWYPRRAIRQAGIWQKASLYLRFVQQLRRFKADLAFNIEEDSTSDRLTRWSGGAFLLGCSTTRHTWGYSQVLPINFATRNIAERHRWFSFQEVFLALGLAPRSPGYIRLSLPPLLPESRQVLSTRGLDLDAPYAVLHAGATKDYKKWPHAHFAALATLLREQGLQVVFAGAGQDAHDTRQIMQLLDEGAGTRAIIDATNLMSLADLGSFLQSATVMIGNDSGPFHLGCTVGTPGVVIFGPTEAALWRPLGAHVELLQKRDMCSAQCSRKQCIHDHRCLTAITPEQVCAAVNAVLKTAQ